VSGAALVKVVISIEQDAGGFPPFTREGVWAKPLGEDRFEVDNVPFYAYGVSLGDVVRASPAGVEGEYVLDAVEESSGHSVVRVKVRARGVDEAEVERRVRRWRETLDAMGCGSEASNLPTLFAVDVPAEVDYQPVRDRLDDGVRSGEIDFEEGNLRHAV
jgi:hypothetical protein